MHIESFETMKANLSQYGSGKVLDVGSLQIKAKHPTYRELCTDYVGTDIIAGPNVDVVCSDMLPFASQSFDTVVTGSCFEHAENPFQLITECARVLKPGGFFIGLAPRDWPEHHNPDRWRFLPEGWQALFKYAKLESIRTYVSVIEPNKFSDCWGIARK